MARNPGHFDQRGTIRQPAVAVRGPGGVMTPGTPTTVAAKVWAHVSGLKTFERIQAMQTTAKPTHRIDMGYREGLDETMELVIGARVLKFTGPPADEKGDRTELVVLAREG